MHQTTERLPGGQNAAGHDDDHAWAVNRRDFISRALLAIGVTGAALSGAACEMSAKTGNTQFLSRAHFAILDAVAETIMPRTDTPGARDALVAKRLDDLLKTWASPATRADFIRVLDEIDLAARPRNPRGIIALTPAQQLEVVAAYDRAKMADRGYTRLKNMIFALYYLSEAGATKELRYEHTPGAWEPSIPVTSDTRGYALDISFGGN